MLKYNKLLRREGTSKPSDDASTTRTKKDFVASIETVDV